VACPATVSSARVNCLACGVANPEGFKFCGQCAGPLDSFVARSSPASPITRDAVEAALANLAALIERTGARTLAPALCEIRAELADLLGDDATRDQLLRQS